MELNLELIQDKYTNLIIYDGTTITDESDRYIPFDGIESIEFVLQDTSDNLESEKRFIIDRTKLAKTKSYFDYAGYDFSGYLNNMATTIVIDGHSIELAFTTNIPSIYDLVSELQTQIGSYGVVNSFGNKFIISSIDTGEEAYITIPNSTLNDIIGLSTGTYKGNDIVWIAATTERRDVLYTILPEDIGFTDEIPMGKWYVDYTVVVAGTPTVLIADNYIEYSYKQIELYRALCLEYMANNIDSYKIIEQRKLTDFELSTLNFNLFDAKYKAFKATLEIGNYLNADKLLVYLANYIELNNVTSND